MNGEEVKAGESFGQIKSKGGKIINSLMSGEERDSTIMVQEPDPFGAEQTYITEKELNEAPQRKGSYDNMD